jgi:hypothetical protein
LRGVIYFELKNISNILKTLPADFEDPDFRVTEKSFFEREKEIGDFKKIPLDERVTLFSAQEFSDIGNAYYQWHVFVSTCLDTMNEYEGKPLEDLKRALLKIDRIYTKKMVDNGHIIVEKYLDKNISR